MNILRVNIDNGLIVRAFTKGTITMHEITKGIPKGYMLINIEYKVPHSIFWFSNVDLAEDGIKDVSVVYDAIQILK